MSLKILWHSESPAYATGFGNVTRYICKGLVSRGVDIHIVSWEVDNETVVWDNLTLHRHSSLGFGLNGIYRYVHKLNPDFVVTFGDPTWLLEIVSMGLDNDIRKKGGKWIVYFTLDGETNEGRIPYEWVQMINVADIRITCSQYAKKIAKSSGIESQYIPHGVDISLFSPPIDKESSKRKLGYENKFVILSDARNQPRKMLPRLIDAFALFAENKKDVILHLHTNPKDPWATTDICSLIEVDGISEKVRFTRGFQAQRGIPLERLVELYQASDLHVLASGGEGFGLPTLQACSCGLVPIAVDYSANRELIEGHGDLVKSEGYEIGRFGLKVAVMDIEDCVETLEKYYLDRQLLRTVGEAARRFAIDYSWDSIIDQWVFLLRSNLTSTTARESVNPWVTRGKINLSRNGIEGNDSLVAKVKPFLRVAPSMKMSINVVVTNPLLFQRKHLKEQGVMNASSSHKPKLTACLSIWNDVNTIERALWSIDGKVDRIILVDGRILSVPDKGILSNDGTLKTLQRLKSKTTEIVLPQRPWANETEKRNAYLKRLFDGDWLFVLEADEYLVGRLPTFLQLSDSSYNIAIEKLDKKGKSKQLEPRLIRVRNGYHYHDHLRLEDSQKRTIFSASESKLKDLSTCHLISDPLCKTRIEEHKWLYNSTR